MNYREYLETVYASWLGKLIGIRLGAPVEGWSSDRIHETYGDKRGYLVDYGIFASDDDSNGPLFFVSALKKGMTPQDVGEVILSKLQEYSGFFWWGGPGVSTEHTAYENLKNGIRAPLSGSKETNGTEIAEQIGGQIFSDCWAYVSLDDTDEAVRLGRLASSVTHDGDGIEGAAFVTAAISLATRIKDHEELVLKALEYVDPQSHYYEVAMKVYDFYKAHPGDWRVCLKFIQDNYGYDRYPGVCHIIPNMAVMVMALCYGSGDFSDTLVIANQAGWDTDCNCGNLGSIAGAMTGIDGIDPEWIRPINDIVNSSSCLGYRNIDTVSGTAEYFADLAFEYAGRSKEAVSGFSLPYATRGFWLSSDINDEIHDVSHVPSADENGLRVTGCGCLYRYAYYLGKDIYDARYDPCFSPLVYPGDTLIFKVSGEGSVLRVFVEDCEGRSEYSPEYVLNGESSISYTILKGENKTVHRYGLVSKDGSYVLTDCDTVHRPCLEFDFRTLPYDEYGPRYAGDTLYNIRGFVVHSGNFDLNDGLHMKSNDHALVSSGVPADVHFIRIEAKGQGAGVVFGMEDARHFNAVTVDSDSVALVSDWAVVSRLNRNRSESDGEISLELDLRGDSLSVRINDELYSFEKPCSYGLFGFCAIDSFETVVTKMIIW